MDRTSRLLTWTLTFQKHELPRRVLGLWLSSLDPFSDEHLEVALGALSGGCFLPKLSSLLEACGRARVDELRAASVATKQSCELCNAGLLSLRGPDGYATVSACSCAAGRQQNLPSPPLDDLLARGFKLEGLSRRAGEA